MGHSIIKIRVDGKDSGILADISYNKYIEVFHNSSNTSQAEYEYDQYLRFNKMKELTDYNSQTTVDTELIVEQEYRGRVLKFKCVYDSDNDEAFDSESYQWTKEPGTNLEFIIDTYKFDKSKVIFVESPYFWIDMETLKVSKEPFNPNKHIKPAWNVYTHDSKQEEFEKMAQYFNNFKMSYVWVESNKNNYWKVAHI